jgi:diguanylate cyclase (GGDEF)-like protein
MSVVVMALLLVATAVCAGGWLKTRRRLAESVQDKVDLAKSSQVIEEERRMLELIAKGASLSEILDTLAIAIERISEGALCTIMLLDEDRRHLTIASGPSLPADYLRAADGIEIGPDVGACGSAAYRGETIVVEDIATDYRFAGARDFVLGHGLRSCWSQPIHDSRNQVLGTFAMYHRHVARPRSEELRLARAAAQLAGNAIERIRAEATLTETSQRLSLAEKVARFGIWQADFEGSTIHVSEGLAVLFELPPHNRRLTTEQFGAMMHPTDRPPLRTSIDPASAREGTFQSEFRLLLPSGSIRWMRSKWRFEFGELGPKGAIGAMVDITDEMKMLIESREARAAAEASALAAREAESLEQDRKAILELVAKDKPLEQIVLTIAHRVASHLPGSICCIRIEPQPANRLAVYPHFPEALARALSGISIGSIRQSLASAAIAELASDAGWLEYIAKGPGPHFPYYRAVPILRETRLAGLMISFFKEDRPCSVSEEKTIESWSQFASLAVERRGLYEQLSFRARYDALTSLLNRAALYEHLDTLISRGKGAQLSAQRSLAVVYLDLDGFKDINDSHGHAAGDQVLQAVAGHIQRSVRHTDLAARMGGDEFVVVLAGIGDRTEAVRIATLLMDAIGEPALFNGREVRVGASFGISVFPADGANTEALLKAADENMYKAKSRQRRRRTRHAQPDELEAPTAPALLGA